MIGITISDFFVWKALGRHGYVPAAFLSLIDILNFGPIPLLERFLSWPSVYTVDRRRLVINGNNIDKIKRNYLSNIFDPKAFVAMHACA